MEDIASLCQVILNGVMIVPNFFGLGRSWRKRYRVHNYSGVTERHLTRGRECVFDVLTVNVDLWICGYLLDDLLVHSSFYAL